MTNHHIEKVNKAKGKQDEILEDDSEKQQLKDYLLAYLKKMEDEKDVPKSTIEELVEINLDPEDPNKKSAGRSLVNKSREGKRGGMPEEE